MNKRVFTMMIALLLAAFVPKAYGQTDVWDGSVATEVTPDGTTYTITTGAELAWVAEQAQTNKFSGKTIKLTGDIDLDNKPWTPIGNPSQNSDGTDGFDGTFDGAGFVISGLSITGSARLAGLFGYITENGTVKNLGVTGSITSDANNARIGGIAGKSIGKIMNCYTDVTVTATGSKANAGGIVGYMSEEEATISNCFALGNCTATAYAGGIAGAMSEEATISNCFTLGNCTATGTTTATAGGIVGYMSFATISNCYATGTINGQIAGGIAGQAYEDDEITGCIALNKGGITGSTGNNRILGGSESSPATIKNCYASPLIPGTWTDAEIGATTSNGADLTTDNFITSPSAENGAFKDWSEASWDLTTTAANLPTLQDFKATQSVPARANFLKKVTIITTKAELEAIKTDPSGSYVLADNIDLDNQSWTPIGNYGSPFGGTFDGAGFVISGLSITGSSEYAGLFGYITKDGTVKNLGVTGSITSDANDGMACAGGIAGQSEGKITNCYTDVTVTATGQYANAGGIAGAMSTATISNCFALGDCTANGDNGIAGGIVGNKWDGSLSYCYATGTIKGKIAGGIAGQAASDTQITGCIALNKGGITGEGSTTNRILGQNDGATITNCYASPLIPGTWTDKEATTSNGADLTTENFITSPSAKNGAFNGWPEASWDLTTTTANLPTLKDFKAAQSVAARADFLEKVTLITTKEELVAIKDLSGSYVLANNITLEDDWTPIGNYSSNFTGTFDGAGFVISGLKVSITKTDGDVYAGLFGYIGTGGTVKNLGVTDGTVEGNASTSSNMVCAGGIVGQSQGTITNCYTNVAVAATGSSAYAGGIVGYMSAATATTSNCFALGNCTATGTTIAIAGGIVANKAGGSLSYCYATGTIETKGEANQKYTGGIVGQKTGTLTGCIALNKGGITGSTGNSNTNRIAGNGSSGITNCYASPLIPGTWTETGADKQNGADLTSDNFVTSNDAFGDWTASNWDFGTTTVNLPMLAGFKSDQPAKDLKRISYMAIIPVLISTKEELAAIAGKDSLYRLANNINLGNVDWTPIDGFSGILDGAGFMVSGLKVAATGDGEVYAGLFGSTKEKSVIRNLGVIGTVEAASTGNSVWAGGIVGKSNSRIENCYSNVSVKSTGTVTDKQSYAGGITGQIYSGYVNNCYALGNCTVEGKGGSYVGGIAGYLSGENTIDYCYATGTIAGSKDTGVAGGIVGNVENGTLTNCIALNTGGITGNAGRANRVAGLGGTITCCYASPLIKVNDILVIGNSDTSDRQGANLTTDNFLVAVSGVENVFNSWVKETNWSFDADHAETQAFFLPTVCTIEEGTVIAGQSVPMPSRSSFLLKTIEITDAVTYDEAVHKGNEIIVKDGGVFTAKAAGGVVKYLTVEAGGMLVASQLKVEGVYTMKVDLVNKWRTFSTPIALVADKQFAGSDDDKDKLWLRTFNFADQTWNLATELATSTAYLLASDNIAGETVTFTAANFVFPATAGIDNTGDANDGIFTFTPNPCVDKTVVSNVYMLNAAGTVFELQASTAVEPFQACMVANAATQLRVKSFSIDGGITGMEAAAADGFHAYADGGKIYIHTGQPADVVVYSLNGLLVKKLASLHGDTSLELPGGAYVVRCNGKSIKVINYE